MFLDIWGSKLAQKIELCYVNVWFLLESALLAYCLQTPSKSDNAHCYIVLTAQSVGTRGFGPGDPGSNPRWGVWKKDWEKSVCSGRAGHENRSCVG